MVDALEGESEGASVAIIAHTRRARVSFMENDPKWHGVAPTKEEATRALAELGA